MPCETALFHRRRQPARGRLHAKGRIAADPVDLGPSRRPTRKTLPSSIERCGGPPRRRRLRSPSRVADTALSQKRLARTRTRSQSTTHPKRADNQIDRARVLEVRIHLPPAESQQTFGSCAPFKRWRDPDKREDLNRALP